MAERSMYNERSHFADPSSALSASRSTRYRSRKRARNMEAEDAADEYEPASEDTLYDSEIETIESENTTEDTIAIVVTDIDLSTDNPQILEAELQSYEENMNDTDEPETSTISECADSNKLYSGAPLTVATSSLLMMQYKMRHNLTEQALGDLQRLLQLHCPTPNFCVPSVYHLKKRFEDGNFVTKLNYFCSNCLQSVKKTDVSCTNQLCTNDFKDVGSLSKCQLYPSFRFFLKVHRVEPPIQDPLNKGHNTNNLQIFPK